MSSYQASNAEERYAALGPADQVCSEPAVAVTIPAYFPPFTKTPSKMPET